MAASESGILSPDDAVMVSDTAFASTAPYDIVESNISVVNDLFAGYLAPGEISSAALASYYVDYYLAQVNNGGFSQFVFNSQWNGEVVDLVRQGLRDMGASRHLALFEEGARSVEALGKEKLAAYLDSQYFGDNPERDGLDAIDERFFALEDLVALNAAWLRRQPNLRVLSSDDLRKEVDRRSAAIPDRAARAEAALEAQPRYVKLIRALCDKSGLTLERVTAGTPTLFYDGNTIRELTSEELNKQGNAGLQITWFFITDKGLYLMAEAAGRAAIFDDETRTKIAEIDASGEP